MVLGALIAPILVRLLGSGGYGDYAVVISAFGFLSTLTYSGIFNGMRKFVAETRETDGWENYVFAFYLRVALVTGTLVAAALLAFATTDYAVAIFGSGFETYFALLAVMVFVRQWYPFARGALMGFGLERYSEPLQLVDQVVFGLCSVLLISLGLGVTGALIGKIVAGSVVGAVAIAIVRPRFDAAAIFRRIPSSISRRELLAFNLHSIVLAVLTVSLYHVDVLLLQPLAGSEQTGYYKAALVVAEMLWFVPMAIQYILVQSTSETWSEGDRERVTTVASDATRSSLLITVLFVVGLAALADEFVGLYFGAEFVAATTPLLLLLPGVLGFAVVRPIIAIGQGIGRMRLLITATGSAAVLNLLLNLLLIPRYGMNGAAVATSIGYGSMLLFHLAAARRIGVGPLTDLRLGRIGTCGAVTAGIVFGLATSLESPLVSLIVIPPMGLLAYATAAVLTNAITERELKRFYSELPGQSSALESDRDG